MSMTKQSHTNTKTKASLDLLSGIVPGKDSINLRKNSSFAHGGRKLVQKKNMKLQK